MNPIGSFLCGVVLAFAIIFGIFEYRDAMQPDVVMAQTFAVVDGSYPVMGPISAPAEPAADQPSMMCSSHDPSVCDPIPHSSQLVSGDAYQIAGSDRLVVMIGPGLHAPQPGLRDSPNIEYVCTNAYRAVVKRSKEGEVKSVQCGPK